MSTRNTQTHEVLIGGVHKFMFTIDVDSRGWPKGIMNFKVESDVQPTWQLVTILLEVIAWQYGKLARYDRHEIDKFVGKAMFQRTDESGFTDNDKIPNCLSLLDYLAKYLKAIVDRRGKDDGKTDN